MAVDPTKTSPDEDTGKTPTVSQSTSATPAQAATQSTPSAVNTTNLDVVARIPKRGDIVDYVLKDGYHPGEKRPLIIVKVWGDTPDALINGQVITDNVNDFITAHPGGSGQFWVTSVECDPTGEKQGTWSFAE
jgi:hypothetical protein